MNKPTENNKSRNNKKLSDYHFLRNYPVTCQPKAFTQASLPETSKPNERNTARVFGNTVMIFHGYSDNLDMYKSKFWYPRKHLMFIEGCSWKESFTYRFRLVGINS